jgi:hypothetical protein
MYSTTSLLISVALLASLDSACRPPPLPPTEPTSGSEASPGTTTNDAPRLGPLAGDGIIAASDSNHGGTSVLPKPPAPAGTSSGGSAGTAIR